MGKSELVALFCCAGVFFGGLLETLCERYKVEKHKSRRSKASECRYRSQDKN